MLRQQREEKRLREIEGACRLANGIHAGVGLVGSLEDASAAGVGGYYARAHEAWMEELAVVAAAAADVVEKAIFAAARMHGVDLELGSGSEREGEVGSGSEREGGVESFTATASMGSSSTGSSTPEPAFTPPDATSPLAAPAVNLRLQRQLQPQPQQKGAEVAVAQTHSHSHSHSQVQMLPLPLSKK